MNNKTTSKLFEGYQPKLTKLMQGYQPKAFAQGNNVSVNTSKIVIPPKGGTGAIRLNGD